MAYPPPPPPYGGDPYGGGGQPPFGRSGPPPPGWGPYPYGPMRDDDQATTALVLGILAIVVCGVIGPFALVTGRSSLKRIDASAGRLGGRGRAQAGYILGIAGTLIFVLEVLLILAVFSVGTVTIHSHP